MKAKYFGSRAAALLMFIFLVLAKLKDRLARGRAHDEA